MPFTPLSRLPWTRALPVLVALTSLPFVPHTARLARVSQAAFPSITVTARAITLSTPLTAGLVALHGPGIVLRLRPGVTRRRMVAAIKHPTPDGSNLLALVVPYGGNGGGANTQEVILDLAPVRTSWSPAPRTTCTAS